MKKLVFLVISLFLISGCGEKVHDVENSDYVKVINDNVLVHSDVNLLDILEKNFNSLKTLQGDPSQNQKRLA